MPVIEAEATLGECVELIFPCWAASSPDGEIPRMTGASMGWRGVGGGHTRKGGCSELGGAAATPSRAPGLVIPAHPHATPSSSTLSKLQEDLLAVSVTLGGTGREPILPLVRATIGRQVGEGEGR